MRNKNILNMILIVLCIALVFITGCNQAEPSQPSQPTNSQSHVKMELRFSWWGGDTRHEATLKAIEYYMEKNPNVYISGEYGGFDGYFTKLTTQLSSMTAPDIIQVDQPVMGDLTSRGDFFVNFEEYEDIIDLSGFDKGFLNDYSYYNNQLLGLPTGINAFNIIINAELAERIGIDLSVPYTWNKLFEDAKNVREYDTEMYMLNIGRNPIRYHILIPYMYQILGTHPIQDDFTLGFTREQLIEAYTLIRRIYEEGVTEPAAQSKPFDAFYHTNPKWVNHQYVAMCHEASMTGSEFYDFPDTATVMLTPIREDAKDSGIVVKPSQLMCVNKNSKYAEEAVKFLDFFFNSDDAAHILKGVRGVPATEMGRRICTENDYLDPLSVKTVNMALEKAGMPVNALTNNSEIMAIQYAAIDKLAFGEGTVEEIADESIRQFENALKTLKETLQQE